jgi:large subunit ribosomal protein L21
VALGAVAEQSARYATSQTKFIESWVSAEQPLPFLYEATNHEIRFRDERDPHPRSRNLFHFHQPETLKNWLEEGDTLRVEKLSGDVGAEVAFDKVLLFSDGETVKIGQPVLEGASVHGHIVEQNKAKKVLVFKYKRRKRYRRKQGHRQLFTAVKIDKIEV